MCSVLANTGEPFGFCRSKAQTVCPVPRAEVFRKSGFLRPKGSGFWGFNPRYAALVFKCSGKLCHDLIRISIMLNTGVFSFFQAHVDLFLYKVTFLSYLMIGLKI